MSKPNETLFTEYLRVLDAFPGEVEQQHFRSIIIGWFMQNTPDDFRHVMEIARKKVEDAR